MGERPILGLSFKMRDNPKHAVFRQSRYSAIFPPLPVNVEMEFLEVFRGLLLRWSSYSLLVELMHLADDLAN